MARKFQSVTDNQTHVQQQQQQQQQTSAIVTPPAAPQASFDLFDLLTRAAPYAAETNRTLQLFAQPQQTPQLPQPPQQQQQQQSDRTPPQVLYAEAAVGTSAGHSPSSAASMTPTATVAVNTSSENVATHDVGTAVTPAAVSVRQSPPKEPDASTVAAAPASSQFVSATQPPHSSVQQQPQHPQPQQPRQEPLSASAQSSVLTPPPPQQQSQIGDPAVGAIYQLMSQLQLKLDEKAEKLALLQRSSMLLLVHRPDVI